MKRIKHVLLCTAVLIMAVLCVVQLSAEASAETEGDFTYSVSNGQASVNRCSQTNGDVVIPETLGGYPVTRISYESFAYCMQMTSITIPEGVTEIGGRAFLNCTALTTVVLPDGILTVDDHAFSGCTSLQNINMPSSIAKIGWDAFSGCDAMNCSVYDNAKYLGNKDNPYVALICATSTAITSCDVADTACVIGGGAFGKCSELTHVSLPQEMRSIGDYAFYKCGKLEELTVPSGVTMIGSYMFGYCSSLTKVTIPESVTWVSCEAFVSCDSLSCNVYDNACYLGNAEKPYHVLLRAASGEITSCKVAEDTKVIASDAFFCCQDLVDISIPEGVTYINWRAFGACSSLVEICLPASVTELSNNLFDGCTSLASVQIPDGVLSIGAYTFYSCNNLKSVSIPTSVTYIGYYPFYNCEALEQAVYAGTSEQWAKIELDDGNDTLVEKLVCVGDVRFSGASLTLQDDLTINYRVSKALIGEYGYTSPYVVVRFNGVETTLTQYTEKEDCLEFRFVNIAPNQMHDTLYATLYATYDGIEYSGVTKEYSVAEYCYSMLELYSADEYSELRTLLVDLLNYGAAAQTYTNYKTATPANAALTETQRGWGTSTEPALQSVLNTKYKTVDAPTAKWKGAGLLLQESVTMRLALTAQDVTDLSVRIESGENTWTIPAEQFEAGDGKYYVYFTGLNAGQMRDTVYLTIYEGDTAVSNTASYSIESYACEMQNSEDAKLVALLKAMMRYGDAANAYAN